MARRAQPTDNNRKELVVIRTRKSLFILVISSSLCISAVGVAFAYTASQEDSICATVQAAIDDGTLTQAAPGGDITVNAAPPAGAQGVAGLVAALRALGFTGNDCFECDPPNEMTICIAMGSGDRTATGTASANLVIALGGDSTGGHGGNATADATNSPGAGAIADGGDGGTSGGGSPRNGGSATATGTASANASGGNGSNGANTGGNGGNGTASTTSTTATATASGGAGGDPVNNAGQGGSSGSATATSSNAAGASGGPTQGGAPGGPGTRGTSPSCSSTGGTQSGTPTQAGSTPNV